jgi:hypothetical protein
MDAMSLFRIITAGLLLCLIRRLTRVAYRIAPATERPRLAQIDKPLGKPGRLRRLEGPTPTADGSSLPQHTPSADRRRAQRFRRT